MRVVSEQRQQVSWLRLQAGPSGRVELDDNGIAGLARAVEAAAGARVLVIESEGAEFCAGMDLASALARSRAELQAGFQKYADCLARLSGGSAATIAIVAGSASGGGVGLAAACDLVVASPGSTFTLPELRFGLVPAVILPALQTRLSLRRIKWMALTGDPLTAAQAAVWGLVDVVADDPRATATGLVRKLLRARPQAVATLKRWQGGAVDGPGQTAGDLQEPELRTALRALLRDGEMPPWFARPEGQE